MSLEFLSFVVSSNSFICGQGLHVPVFVADIQVLRSVEAMSSINEKVQAREGSGRGTPFKGEKKGEPHYSENATDFVDNICGGIHACFGLSLSDTIPTSSARSEAKP